MDNNSPVDRSLWVPILLGGFSIIGIIVVLLVGRSVNSPPPISASPSSTSFQYVYLGTEPAITTPIVDASDIPVPTEAPVEEVTSEVPEVASPTSPGVPSPVILTRVNTTRTATSSSFRTNTPPGSATFTATLSTPAALNTYDDTDPRLAYSNGWVNQTGVNGAYQGTLHISNANGNTVTFTFTGQEIRVYYQAGPSLGSMTITIDGLGGPAIPQADTTTQVKYWQPDNLLTSGTHLIVISHSGGGSINVDSLVVPGPTPTPTSTPTRTPTQS